MEVVDQVTDTQSSKAVKFEHKSKIMWKHAHINMKTKQGRKSQYKKSYLRPKNQRISWNKSKIYDIVLRNRVKSNICDHNEVEFKDANKEDQLSRPSSVTTLYTSCSNVINASQICDFTDKESLNKLQNSWNSITNLIQNREVIEEIDDSISRSSSIYLDQKDIKLADTKESQDLSLVSEIQSINEETSKKDIRSPKMIDSKFNIKHTKIYFTKQHDKAWTKAPTKIFPKNKSKWSQNSKREFRCFNDADVVKFLDMKPPTLSYQLERGDEDEDTDEEDLDRNSNYSIFELNKAITMHLKDSTEKEVETLWMH